MGLSNINLSFRVGEFVAITGESGSGKSTLGHVLGGIIPYESGELYINGEPTSHYDGADWERHRRDNVAFISQSYGILVGNTVMENLLIALRLAGVEAGEAERRAEKMLTEVELYEYRDRRASKLSSGQKQRLSIACALAKPSKILVADEPTGNLDRENSEKVIKLLAAASRERLVILITHEFDEAKEYATRRITLSDGVVVSDREINEAQAPLPVDTAGSTAERKKPLAPFIAKKTVRARPVFAAIMCLFLALTSFISFVFLGNIIIYADDTHTRIYDISAFRNGDTERLVVMKDGKAPFADEDYAALLSLMHVEYIDRYSYVNDVNYYYREGSDFRYVYDAEAGENFSDFGNNEDYVMVKRVELINDLLFMRSLPVTGGNIITEGRAPESCYEAVSADPSYKVGDVVKVYVRETDNRISPYYNEISVKIVGESSYGEGLYFSDGLCAAVSYMVENSYKLILPFDAEMLEAYDINGERIETLPDNAALVCRGTFEVRGEHVIYLAGGDGAKYTVDCVGYITSTDPSTIVVGEELFEQMISGQDINQLSVYISDYAYTERVLAGIKARGYLAISPFKEGATKINAELAELRTTTLIVCSAALAFLFVLQLILTRVMFSSQFEHYRLMYNVGMTARTGRASLALQMCFYLLLANLISGGALIIMSLSGVWLIREFTIYLTLPNVIFIIAMHALSVAFAAWVVMLSMQSSIFKSRKAREDIDFSLLGGVFK